MAKVVNSEKIILGIDPGTTIMGFGLIKVVNKVMLVPSLERNEVDTLIKIISNSKFKQ